MYSAITSTCSNAHNMGLTRMALLDISKHLLHPLQNNTVMPLPFPLSLPSLSPSPPSPHLSPMQVSPSPPMPVSSVCPQPSAPRPSVHSFVPPLSPEPSTETCAAEDATTRTGMQHKVQSMPRQPQWASYHSGGRDWFRLSPDWGVSAHIRGRSSFDVAQYSIDNTDLKAIQANILQLTLTWCS